MLRRFIKRRLKRGIEALLYPLFGSIGLAARLARGPGRPFPDASTVRRILIIRLDLLGDVLNSMTAVEALHERYPTARIMMLTLPYTAAIPRRYTFVDEVLTLDTNRVRSAGNLLKAGTYRDFRQTIARLRGERFDLCVSLYGRMASLFAFASGARRRIGYGDEGYPYLFTDPVPRGRFARRRHELCWDLDLAAAAGASRTYRTPWLQVDAAVSERMALRLRRLGISAGDTVIGIHGGAANGSAKRWPALHWAALADRLIGEHGCTVVLTGSASERAIAEEIAAGMASRPLILTGETSVDELLAVLARCDLVISGDSGPLHMAVALGRPTVSLYGPTDPAIYGPTPRAGQQAVVIRLGLGCSPCYGLHAVAECPHGQPSCMIDIAVGRVLRASLEVLGRQA